MFGTAIQMISQFLSIKQLLDSPQICQLNSSTKRLFCYLYITQRWAGSVSYRTPDFRLIHTSHLESNDPLMNQIVLIREWNHIKFKTKYIGGGKVGRAKGPGSNQAISINMCIENWWCLGPGYFLLESKDCMLETCLLLAMAGKGPWALMTPDEASMVIVWIKNDSDWIRTLKTLTQLLLFDWLSFITWPSLANQID